jgi:tetratricopeptide (TPR) repeat protein
LKEYLSNVAKKAVEYKVKANNLFKKGKYTDAISNYNSALDELNAVDKKYYEMNLPNINFVRLECLNNIAMCYLILKQFEKVIEYTNKVLEINSNNFLALSYKAKALIGLNHHIEAIEFIKQALRIKFSRSLMNNLKEIESEREPKTSSKENTSIEDSIEQIKEPLQKHSIFRLLLIIKQGTIQFFKNNKFLLIVLLLVLIVLLRKKAGIFVKKVLRLLNILT